LEINQVHEPTDTLLSAVHQTAAATTVATDGTTESHGDDTTTQLMTEELTTTSSSAAPASGFSVPSIIRRSTSSTSVMLKLDPSSPSPLLPPPSSTAVATDLFRVQESLLRAEEELRLDSSPIEPDHIDIRSLSTVGLTRAPLTKPALQLPSPIRSSGESTRASAAAEGTQALESSPTEAQLPIAVNSSFDLFCFNEGNSEEIDTSRDEADEPLRKQSPLLHQPHESSAVSAGIAATEGEAMELDDGFTGSGRPIDERGAQQASFTLQASVDHTLTGTTPLGEVQLGHARDLDDIGIYAEEEIGDEWEEEMEACGGGLDDSREDDERDMPSMIDTQHFGGSETARGDSAFVHMGGSSVGDLGGGMPQDGFGSRLKEKSADKEGDRDQMWKAKFDQLKEFHDQNGHCEVKGRKNKALSAWIRRQRYARLARRCPSRSLNPNSSSSCLQQVSVAQRQALR
jgi:hypothetical protein